MNINEPRVRMQPHERMDAIIQAIIAHVEGGGDFFSLNREKAATIAGCAPSLISYHFETMESLRYAVIKAGRRRGVTLWYILHLVYCQGRWEDIPLDEMQAVMQHVEEYLEQYGVRQGKKSAGEGVETNP